ncbi:stage II sporulation protein P [Halalkalibacter alkaliphilus]|uniref:Stage II sporulation protein P n=1 Tax=Halalkalibacter alkaliphilus TaxID=2917993 RepID=A0A9X2CS86_9BACI|nr:stage II sporulation protein P [Halalkalibacter alkaliphilus]MCL7747281.1 stage II sporulation protein P [Halalkalibacter alkaliphilus]
MKRNHFRSFTINRTSLKRLITMTIIGIMALFIFTGMLTSFEPGYGLASNQVHEWANNISGEDFVHVLGMENKLFTQALPEGSEPPSLSNIAFQVATSINPDDPRSLLGRELPGFALFDGQIIVAGEGMDYTTLPVESAPPMDVMMAEREATQESLAQLEEMEKEAQQSQGATNGEKIVHIIHSHNTESFLPELETNVPNEAFHRQINITLVGEKLAQELEKRGIGVEVEDRDIQQNLQERSWQYSQSYDQSREFVKEAMANNEDLKFFFDLHRDTIPRENTTVTINGVEYARTVFVIGGRHGNYDQNLQLAKELHELIEKKYPGLSRGVLLNDRPGQNGIYNQDLSGNSILIEMGGIYNTLTEANRTAEAIADVFAEYYFEHEGTSAE